VRSSWWLAADLDTISYAEDITSGLDPAIATAIEPELPALADEIVAAIQREVPEYARPLRGEFGRGIRAGVEQALRRFARPQTRDDGRIYRALGRGEHREGRSLDALQAAYRVGARVAWRRVSRMAADAGAPLEAQHALAEAIFAYIDQLAAESVEGYADAQAAGAGERQRRREELLALLVTAPGVDGIDAAAEAAAWTLPRRVAIVATGQEDAARLARRLSGDALHGVVEERGCIAVPEPATLGSELAVAAARHSAAAGLGPAVALAEAPRSWRWASIACGLAEPGAVVEAEDRLADLALASAADLADALRERALAPLHDETPGSRARLEDTLRAWLRHRGAQQAAATELGVHAQTVRYRLGRLRELFGDALDDPDQRFALELALRSRHGSTA
jgi:hypothetical protein